MVTLTIDRRSVQAEEGQTILQAAKSIGIRVPTLCYLKDINEIGGCRVCMVEVEGRDRLCASCNTYVEEGMVVYTNSERARKARKVNVELILAQHDCRCPTCVRSGNCSLQKLANDMNIFTWPYERKLRAPIWDKTFPLIRENTKCIKCMRCINVCDKIQDMRVWDVDGVGARTQVNVRDGLDIHDVNCTLCGQCITHCPVGALRERDDTERVFAAIADPELVTLVQVAPAVRTAWGEGLGLAKEGATEKRMAATCRALGIDYVFDTNFSADLTIMEEASELVRRLSSGEAPTGPMFTSCCPGWVRFLKMEYPQLVPQLSTSKSPQQMFGAVAKSYFAEKIGVDPKKIFSISFMPCLAKKYECTVDAVNDTAADYDVDAALTTREMSRMIRASHLDASMLLEEDFDSPLGVGSGAGCIFGATGGVMEAALRTAYFQLTGTNAPLEAFTDVRGMAGWKEASFSIQNRTLHVAVVSGLGNARRICEAILEGEVQYDFVEVMACPGGCAGGGGQPIHDGQELAQVRGQELYALDMANPLRRSYENPEIQALYREYLGEPLSEKAEQLLHTNHMNWTR